MGDLAIRIVIATCRWPVKARSPVKESDKNHSEALAWQTAGRAAGGAAAASGQRRRRDDRPLRCCRDRTGYRGRRAAAAAGRDGADGAAGEDMAALRLGTCTVAALLGCLDDTSCPTGACQRPLLPRYQPQLHDKVTLEACAAACHQHRLGVAGIDAGNHCFCGSLADLSEPAARQHARPLAECQATPCHAAPAEKCGGLGRLLAFNFSCSAPTPPPPSSPPQKGADGGAFGRWALDGAGMPIFQYTLDQNSPEGASVAAAYFELAHQDAAEWRNKTDHLFEMGNDRLVLVASNFGYVQVRQDELGPK
jgi:hypothetical protein